MKYSCIIPVYNEAPRVGSVLEAVLEVQEITEVICVDGGSTDGSAVLIKKDYPEVILIQHKSREGKTRAITAGLERTKEKNIILLDSDMIGLSSEEIEHAIRNFENNELDCLILSKSPMGKLDALQRKVLGGLLLSQAGERIIKKSDLEAALKIAPTQGYQLEIAQNRYLIDNNKKVAFMDISARNVIKSKKVGLWSGIVREIAMWKQVSGYAGFPFLVKQSFFFTKQRIS